MCQRRLHRLLEELLLLQKKRMRLKMLWQFRKLQKFHWIRVFLILQVCLNVIFLVGKDLTIGFGWGTKVNSNFNVEMLIPIYVMVENIFLFYIGPFGWSC